MDNAWGAAFDPGFGLDLHRSIGSWSGTCLTRNTEPFGAEPQGF
jgi:hypothetical protein